MLRISIITLFISAFGTASFSQQEYQLSNIAFNPYYLNPAAGGLTDVAQIEITGRTQWMAYDNGPKTMLVSGHSQIRRNKNENALAEFNVKGNSFYDLPEMTAGKVKHVIGGKAGNDAIGPFSKTSAYGSYAIHLPLVKNVNFGAGVGLGWSNFSINQDRVVLYEEDDQAYQSFLGNTSMMNFADVNAGIVIYHEKFFFGFSTTQLLNNKVSFNDNQTVSNFNRHYFLVGRYSHELNSSLAIEPNVVAKFAVNSPASFDIGARMKFSKSTWLGLQYRTSNAIVCQVGSTLVKNLYLSYSYEYATGRISTASNSTHELQIGFLFGNNRNIDKELKQNKKEAEEVGEE